MMTEITGKVAENLSAKAKIPPPRPAYQIVLLSTYELGRQPFGLASPAVWLNRPGVAVRIIAGFDDRALCYRWRHPDPRIDAFRLELESVIRASAKQELTRREVFEAILQLVSEEAGEPRTVKPSTSPAMAPCTIPYLAEPWFCWAEPTSEVCFAMNIRINHCGKYEHYSHSANKKSF